MIFISQQNAAKSCSILRNRLDSSEWCNASIAKSCDKRGRTI